LRIITQQHPNTSTWGLSLSVTRGRS